MQPARRLSTSRPVPLRYQLNLPLRLIFDASMRLSLRDQWALTEIYVEAANQLQFRVAREHGGPPSPAPLQGSRRGP